MRVPLAWKITLACCVLPSLAVPVAALAFREFRLFIVENDAANFSYGADELREQEGRLQATFQRVREDLFASADKTLRPAIRAIYLSTKPKNDALAAWLEEHRTSDRSANAASRDPLYLAILFARHEDGERDGSVASYAETSLAPTSTLDSKLTPPADHKESSAESPQETVANSNFFQGALSQANAAGADAVYFSDAHKEATKDGDRWVIWAATAVKARLPFYDDKTVGVLALKINLHELLRCLERQPLLIVLADQRGRCLLHPNKPLKNTNDEYRLEDALPEKVVREFVRQGSPDRTSFGLRALDAVQMPNVDRHVVMGVISDESVESYLQAAQLNNAAKPTTDLSKRAEYARALSARLEGLRSGVEARSASPLRFTQIQDRWSSRFVVSDLGSQRLDEVEQILQNEFRMSRLRRVKAENYLVDLAKFYLQPAQQQRYWVLGAAISYEELRSETIGQIQWFRYIFFGILLTLPLAFVLSQVFTASITQLIKATRRVANNQFDVQLPENRHDEIGELARSFRSMLGEIHRRGQALKDSEAKTRAILTLAAEAIVTVDEDERIRSVNRAAEQIFGYPADELIGQPFDLLWESGSATLLAPHLRCDELPALDDSCVTSKSEGPPARYECVGRRKDQTTFPAQTSVSRLVINDKRLLTAIVRDVTAQKQAETAIEDSRQTLELRVAQRTGELQNALDQLERARHARELCLASVSHEIRSPLTKVIGFSQELALTPLNEEQRKYLKIVEDSGDQLLRLIKDIMDVQKIVIGQLPLEPVEFDPAQLLHRIVEGLRLRAQQRNNRLCIECSRECGRVRLDPARLEQVIANLLTNACKFTSGGTITVRAARTRLPADEPQHDDLPSNEMLTISVQDTGCGMTDEQQAKLFQPFVKLSAPDDNAEGTGLGLVICEGICKAMGGAISVASSAGVGTTVSLTIPLVSTSVPPSTHKNGRLFEPAGRSTRQRNPNSVLVVDDDPDVRELLQKYLAIQGFDVATAADGNQGFEIARRLQPGIITLDAIMPEPDGWQLLARLKNDVLTADIPVIMVTILDDKSRGFTLGVADYVTKPIDWQQLSQALLRIRDRAPSGNVLIVEDDAAIRSLAAKMLVQAGWKVIEAENGVVAMTLVEDAPPDLVLLDLMMPEMDGFDFLDQLRRIEEWSSIPVIVLTAKELTPEDRRRLNGRVVEVVAKCGSDWNNLAATIDRLVSRPFLRTSQKMEGTHP